MEQISLKAQKRIILGRKVKKLRKDGFIPAHVFGHKVVTIHVQAEKTQFLKVFEKAGETGIVSLSVDGKDHPVMIRNVQVHPVSDEILHVDFYQVNLTEKVNVHVPLEITGDSPAVVKKIGLLLTPVSEIEIEALPADIPENIQVNVAKLENIGDEIRVKDLSIDKSKIEVKVDEELVVASIGELVTKEMEALEAEVEAEQAEAAAEATPAEGVAETPAEGEQATEGESKAQEPSGQPEEEPKQEN